MPITKGDIYELFGIDFKEIENQEDTMSEDYELITVDLLEEYHACSEHIEKFKAFCFDQGIEGVDPEDAELIREAEEYGLDVEWARNQGLVPEEESEAKPALITEVFLGVVTVELPEGPTEELVREDRCFEEAKTLKIEIRPHYDYDSGIQSRITSPVKGGHEGGLDFINGRPIDALEELGFEVSGAELLEEYRVEASD